MSHPTLNDFGYKMTFEWVIPHRSDVSTQLGLLKNSKSGLFCIGDQAEFVGITAASEAGEKDQTKTPAHWIVFCLSTNSTLRGITEGEWHSQIH